MEKSFWYSYDFYLLTDEIFENASSNKNELIILKLVDFFDAVLNIFGIR